MARAKKTRGASTDRPGQADPTAPLDGGELLAAARPVLQLLREDLGKRAEDAPVDRALRARHEDEKAARRTADSFGEWRDGLLAQVAASWFLSCVFVRTLEDRGLLGQARIVGPGATDSQRLFFQLAPSLTERDYLLFVFRELAELPAARALFDREHAMVWQLSPSADAAKELLRLFRTPSAEEPAFRFGQSSTRFLGDLYQDLYEDVRKRYALLQTPDFIESFILDRTLEPAIERFGLDDTTLIDPTCGSGHFLLGAFDRLFEHRLRTQPGIDVRQAAHQALDAVYGSDINPYAVAIARVRLTLSYLEKVGIRRLRDAPALPLHLVVADSLLYNPQHVQLGFEHVQGQTLEGWRAEAFQLEDPVAARDVLHRQYAAVVGNPPYINVRDRALRETYRRLYTSAVGEYPLSVPFLERFFCIARERGFVGLLTNSSFARRPVGVKIVEEFLSSMNVLLVANVEGAQIPGHSTPTLILVGSAEPPATLHIQIVLNNRREPPDSELPGPLWRSVASHWFSDGYKDDFITTMAVKRAALASHPWTLSADAGSAVLDLIESLSELRLGAVATGIGFMAQTNADHCFMLSSGDYRRFGVESQYLRRLIVGADIRDWQIQQGVQSVFPYDWPDRLVDIERVPGLHRFLWPLRPILENRATFSGGTYQSEGLPWWKWHQVTASRVEGASIVFAEAASHNHFCFTEGNEIFKKTAPVIKLTSKLVAGGNCFALLAYLNSSLACCWMKAYCPNRGSAEDLIPQVEGERVSLNVARHTTGSGGGYEFSGQILADLPIPKGLLENKRLARLGKRAHELGTLRTNILSSGVGNESVVIEESARLALLIVGIQEEIDWTIYHLCGMIDEQCLCDEEQVPGLAIGERPFEINLAKKYGISGIPSIEGPDGIRLTAELPKSLTPAQRRVWECRVRAVETLALAETYATKRRYLGFDNQKAVVAAVEDAALSDLEAAMPLQIGTIGALVRERVSALQASDKPEALDIRPEHWFVDLVERHAVPFLSVYMLSDAGCQKLDVWRAVWNSMRKGASASQTPPTFTSKDFRVPRYWTLRGPVNLPKERFISYPGCESDEDGEPVYGWAGWNHLQRAQALASLYQNRKTEEGWTAERLKPMLAGLLELLPWVKQWHNEPDAEFDNQKMGDFFAQYLDGECQALGLTHADLEAWRPTKKTAARKKTAVGTDQSSIDDEPVKPKRARKKQAAVTEASGDAPSIAPPKEPG